MNVIPLLVVDRATLCFVLSLERAFVDRWLAGGEPPIPAMPVISGTGKAAKFHLATVEAWYLKHFQTAGMPAAKSRPVSKPQWCQSGEHDRRHLVKPGKKEARCGATALRWTAQGDATGDDRCATCKKRAL